MLQVFEEAGRENTVDRCFVCLKGTAAIARDAADDREMVARPPFGEDRRLTAGRPRQGDRRQRIEPRFIDEYDRAGFTAGFFSAASK